MKQSIENIWKEGFLHSDALIAPKLNNLYEQKSQHIVDTLMRMGKVNLQSILLGAAILLIASFLLGALLAGCFISLLLVWLVYYGKKQADKMKEIDKGLSSYEYILSVKKWLNEAIAGYTRIYRFFYPAFILALASGFWFSSWGQLAMKKIAIKFPSVYMSHGIPVFWALGLLGVAVLSSIFAGKIYQLDIKIVYGNVLGKLDELLNDMEELRH